MPRICKVLLALGVVLSVISCSSVSVASNKNANFDQVITKIGVVIDVGDHKTMSGDLGDWLTTNIPKALQGAGVDAVAYKATGVELTEEQYTNGATLVMLVKLVDGLEASQGWAGSVLASGTFDVTIVDRSNNNSLVWRANVKSSLGYGGIMNLDGIPKGIVSKLETDGLVKPATKS